MKKGEVFVKRLDRNEFPLYNASFLISWSLLFISCFFKSHGRASLRLG